MPSRARLRLRRWGDDDAARIEKRRIAGCRMRDAGGSISVWCVCRCQSQRELACVLSLWIPYLIASMYQGTADSMLQSWTDRYTP